MMFFVVLCLVGIASCADPGPVGPPYVWDLQKPRLDAEAVQALLAEKADGQYPTYSANPIAETSFACSSKKMPGYYADEETQCQVFHRCDQDGNMTTYICDNTTVYDQVTLVCDFWFNVDCSRTTEFQYFANRRLYQEELPLFDTPTAEYVAPQASEAHNGEVSTKKKRKGSRHSNSGRNGGAGSRNGSGSSGSGGKKGRKGRSRDKAAAQSSGDSVVNQSDLLSQSGSSQPGY